MIDFGEVEDYCSHWAFVLSRKLAKQTGRPSDEEDFYNEILAAGWRASQKCDINKNARGFIYTAEVNKMREIARHHGCQKMKIERNHFASLDEEGPDGYRKPLPKRLEVNYGNRVSVIRDYVDNLKSDDERELCSLYLDGVSVRDLAGMRNQRQFEIVADLRAALGGLEHF